MENLIKINLPGGFISAGDMYEILLIAETAGAVNIRFGNRQQLYFNIHPDKLEDMESDMLKAEIDYEINADIYPNIISSYIADIIFNHHEGWLREGVYKDIFDRFDYLPKLKVNLVDNHQTFVPFFSGNINFIASNTNNYWFVYIRFPKTGKLYCCPSLVYSEDIPAVAKAAEAILMQNKELFINRDDVDGQLFYKILLKNISVSLQPVTEALKLPDFYLPYYEGFNKYNNKYWLGIYRRNELFSLKFLKDICLLCLKTRIGQIYTSPWKSILIKGIEQAERYQWGLMLSKYHLNVRHAANELNWQIEDICAEGLELKQHLVRQFEEADLRTYQLCFAIKTQPKTGLQASVILKKEGDGSYNILHTRDFNPNSKDEIIYAQRIKPQMLSKHLIALCNDFYDMQSNAMQISALPDQTNTPHEKTAVYQCNCCLTRYDKLYGDISNNIKPGTDFETLIDYTCPVCESSSRKFSLVKV
jgi:rubredoxin